MSNSHHCRCQVACYVFADGQAMAHCHFRRKRTGVVQLHCVTNHERKYTTRLETFQCWGGDML